MKTKKSLIQAIREWFRRCPALRAEEDVFRLNVNYLSDEADYFTLEPSPAEQVLERYMDGSSARQFVFVLASRNDYGEEIPQNERVLQAYEEIADWLELQSDSGVLPELGPARQAESIEPLTSGYLLDLDGSGQTGRYQMQCRMTYRQEAPRSFE